MVAIDFARANNVDFGLWIADFGQVLLADAGAYRSQPEARSQKPEARSQKLKI
jgi:hypothetical protein